MTQNLELGVDELQSPETIRATVAEGIATALFLFRGVGSVVSITAALGSEGTESVAVRPEGADGAEASTVASAMLE